MKKSWTPNPGRMTEEERHLLWSLFTGSSRAPAGERGTAKHLRDKHGVEPDLSDGARSSIRQHAELHGGEVDERGNVRWGGVSGA